MEKMRQIQLEEYETKIKKYQAKLNEIFVFFINFALRDVYNFVIISTSFFRFSIVIY